MAQETINNQDRKSTLFVGDREITFMQRVASEAIECVSQQKIRYYAIEGALSNADDLYGEATNKVFRQPIELYVLVLYNAPVVSTGAFSYETKYSMKFYIQKYRIEQDLKMTPRMGDFVEFGQKYFEIFSVVEPQLILGQDAPGYKMGVYCEAISTRSDIFSPHKISPTDPAINPDSIR